MIGRGEGEGKEGERWKRGGKGETGARSHRRLDEAENGRGVALLSVSSHPEED